MIRTQEELFRLSSAKDKTAVITGGSSGIGLAIAWGFASAGADVVLLARREETLEQVKAEFAQNGHEAAVFPCDVSDPAQVSSVFEQIALTHHGTIDILVNSAGMTLRKPAEAHTAEDFQTILTTNVIGTFNCCLAASRYMIPQRSGKIINIGSARGSVGSPVGTAAYGSSKAAVHMLTRQLATEWAKYNINVNCIIPNLTRTPMADALMNNKNVYDSYMSRIPFKRPAECDDYVGAALYFGSALSSFVTGQLLYVDGGSFAG